MTQPPRHPAQHGFSLVELMIVLAIAAVLAAIALPSYHGYVAETRRTAARVALVQAAQWLERMATATGAYPKSGAIPPSMLKTEGGYYHLAAVTQDASFELQAVPEGTQAGDRCGTLGLLHNGEHLITHATPGTTVDACWRR